MKRPTIRLSPMEQRLFDMLSKRSRPIDTIQLAEAYYRGDGPETARLVIAGALRTLERKTKRSNVRVVRGPRRGPHPMEVWIEAR